MLAAWRDYAAHWNNGRGVVLIGHSQGAFMLERLLREQYGSIKHMLVSALLLGGDVTIDESDRDAGVPACRSLSQTGCIVAYSSWGRVPPIFPWFLSEGITPGPVTPQSRTIWVGFPGLYRRVACGTGRGPGCSSTAFRHPVIHGRR